MADAERDTSRVSSLPPQQLILPITNPVTQIACGLYHTVLLTLTGEVYTFGSNQYGQLGSGDLQPYYGPVKVKVSGSICKIAAGSNHTVLLTNKGIVYTFGNHQKGQLGRVSNDVQSHSNISDDKHTKLDADYESRHGHSSNIARQRKAYLWNCTPGAVV